MCRWTLLWVSLTSLVVAIPEEQQYCAVRYRRLCQGKGRHVACQFPDEWDRELALLAQRLADQCHFVHDDCRATVRYPYAGQTVGEVRWRRYSESDELSAQRAIRRVLDAWWGERRRVQPKQLTAPFRLTAKGTVWGHFSQLAVWNLQAVGCGAVRHGAHHARLLLVCDFSHTNMLGQRTLVSGSIAPCPIHTTRRTRTAYPLLCAPVRHPVPPEREEVEMEDNYEDYEEEHEDSDDITTIEVGEVSPPRLWLSKSDKRWLNPKLTPKSTTLRDFPGITRKVDTPRYREFQTTPVMQKDSVIQKLDRELVPKPRNKVQISNVNHKQAHNTFHNNQFDNIVRNDWRTRKKPNFEQWRQKQESPDNLEEVIPLTIPRREITETLDPTIAEIYRSVVTDIPRSTEELYRPTVREDNTDHDDTNFRPRWRQTRLRPQRPGVNALLSLTSTGKHSKKEFIASLNLDKEDIDQLFRDTGFNVHWRKHTT